MCSLILFLIFSCYDQHERRQREKVRKDAFVKVRYSSNEACKSLVSNETCAVCLEEFHAKEKIAVCKCKHGFHKHCILAWLRKKNTCPLCKTTILDSPLDNSRSDTRTA